MKHNGASYDVVVVGAGPAGCSAGYHLARLGLRALMIDKSSFPRDKACGDGLTRRSISLLREMGLDGSLAPFQRTRGLRVVDQENRSYEAAYAFDDAGYGDQGCVIPRLVLDQILVSKAIEAGAEFRQGVRVKEIVADSGWAEGVRCQANGTDAFVRASFVIVANGSSSSLGIGPTPPVKDIWSRGFAMRGYYENLAEPGDLFVVYAPIRDPARNRTLAGYGWLFPLGLSRANIGVGYFPRRREDLDINLREVFDAFVERLRTSDRRFRAMRLAGPVRGAPLASGLELASCVGNGVLFAGDAAGLVDPFTGEGIHTALESGKIAAEAAARAIRNPSEAEAALESYRSRLCEQFGRRFQAGRHLVKHYGFLWKVLETTSGTEGRLFNGLRFALLDYGTGSPACPEPAAGPRARDQRPDAPESTESACILARLREVLESEFPLLSRICEPLLASLGIQTRVRMLLLAAQFGPKKVDGIRAALALELAHLACELHASVRDREQRPAGRQGGLRWGNLFAITAGDGLLAKAYEYAAGLGCEICALLSETSAWVYLARMKRVQRFKASHLGTRDYLEQIESTSAPFSRLACSLGAILAGCPEGATRSLEEFGRRLGVALFLADELRLLNCPRSRAAALAAALEAGEFPFSATLAQEIRGRLPTGSARGSHEASGFDLHGLSSALAGGDALQKTGEIARSYVGQARVTLLRLPPGSARLALERLADEVERSCELSSRESDCPESEKAG